MVTNSKVTATTDARAVGRQVSYNLMSAPIVHVLNGPEENADLFYLKVAEILGTVEKEINGNMLSHHNGRNFTRDTMRLPMSDITFICCVSEPEYGGGIEFVDFDFSEQLAKDFGIEDEDPEFVDHYIRDGGMGKVIKLKKGQAVFFKNTVLYGELAFLGWRELISARITKS